MDTHKHVVIEHRHAGDPNQCFYVGSCRFGQMMDSPAWLIQNDAYRAALENANGIYEVNLLGIFESATDASSYAAEMRQIRRPVTMLGAITKGRVKRVDIPDGESFISASEAARHYRVSPSAMSSHLNKRRGYETIHGMKFERDHNRYFEPPQRPAVIPPGVLPTPAAPDPRTLPAGTIVGGQLARGNGVLTPLGMPTSLPVESPVELPSDEAAYRALTRQWGNEP